MNCKLPKELIAVILKFLPLDMQWTLTIQNKWSSKWIIEEED